MPASDLIQQQRDILRAFRTATTERTQAEADADARRKRELEAAASALKVAQQKTEAQRSKAVADAEARRKTERTAAETTLGQTRARADARLVRARRAQEDAKGHVTEVGLGDALSAGGPRPASPQPGMNPAQESARAAVSSHDAESAVKLDVAALLKWRQDAAVRRRRMILGAVVAVVVTIAAFGVTEAPIARLIVGATGIAVGVLIFLPVWGGLRSAEQRAEADPPENSRGSHPGRPGARTGR